jgi:DNA ligase-1
LHRLREIEAAAGRRAVTTLLAGLFQRGPQDAHILPYLLQGRLGPPFAAPDLGIDERGIAQAIAGATGRPTDEVWKEYGRRGDLGVVAEQLFAAWRALTDARTGEPISDSLSVRQVFAQLVKIAAASGQGAREQKVATLRDLLLHLHGAEARYVVRIIQGKLRLHIGDATIIDALSVASAARLRRRSIPYGVKSQEGVAQHIPAGFARIETGVRQALRARRCRVWSAERDRCGA